MANYNERINLANLEKVGVTTLNGANGPVQCVVIPVKENNIFIGDKGIYLDLVIIETKDSKYGDTHFVKRQLSKDERAQEKLSGQRIGKILGNLKEIAPTSGTYNGETYSQGGNAPTQQITPAPQNTPVAPYPSTPVQMPSSNDEPDLPF